MNKSKYKTDNIIFYGPGICDFFKKFPGPYTGKKRKKNKNLWNNIKYSNFFKNSRKCPEKIKIKISRVK